MQLWKLTITTLTENNLGTVSLSKNASEKAYYHQKINVQAISLVAERLNTKGLTIWGTFRKIIKFGWNILVPSLEFKNTNLEDWKKSVKKLFLESPTFLDFVILP